MTLAYEDGASTIDWASGVSEGPRPMDRPREQSPGEIRGSRWLRWPACRSRPDFVRGSDCRGGAIYFPSIKLRTVRPFATLFCWPVRDMTGQRRVVSVRETGAFPEPVVAKVQRELRAFGPGVEFHLHLLTTRRWSGRRPRRSGDRRGLTAPAAKDSEFRAQPFEIGVPHPESQQ